MTDLNPSTLYFGVCKKPFCDYVLYKQSLGYNYGRVQLLSLKRLNDFIDINLQLDTFSLTENLINKYLDTNFKDVQPQTYRNMECLLRQLGLFLKNNGYKNIYIYPQTKQRNINNFVPYIFSKEEIIKIFQAIDLLPLKTKYNPNNRLFFQVLFRLLYGTGLRISEALSLIPTDVDLYNNILTIKEGKGNITRIVPINNQLGRWLKKYYDVTNTLGGELFFKSLRNVGKIPSTSNIRRVFYKDILVTAKITDSYRTNKKPRIHDLRHTFACHCLDKILEEGKNLNNTLPYLSVYMGHKGIESTEKYLRLTESNYDYLTQSGHYILEESLGDINE